MKRPSSTLGGLAWTLSGKGVSAVLHLLVLAVLSRLLTPAEFGVVTAAVVIVELSKLFARLGLGPALVQLRTLTQRHVETVFISSVVFGSLMGALIWTMAPVYASFVRMPDTTAVLRALAFLFPLTAIATMSESLLQRELRFKLLSQIDVISYAVGYGLVGIALAYLGGGVWAIVGARYSQAVFSLAVVLIVRPIPALRFDTLAFRELFYFGGGVTVGKLLNQVALQGDNVVIARILGPAALGLYGRAYQLMALPGSMVGEAIDRVLFPVLSRIQGSERQLLRAYRRGVALVALFTLPAAIFSMVLAPELVRVVLGSQWSGAVLPFRILAIGMFLRTSHRISDSLVSATGAVYRKALRQFAYATLVLGGAWVGSRWGLPGAACGVMFAIAGNYLLMAQLSLNLVGGSWLVLVRAHLGALTLTAIVGPLALLAATGLRYLNLSAVWILSGSFLVVAAVALLIIRSRGIRFFGVEARWIRAMFLKRFSSRASAAVVVAGKAL
jgi:O-antigen/teichoic acid export membrane protein